MNDMDSYWWQGYDAFLCGKTLQANPYAIGDSRYYAWEDGYYDAHEDMMDQALLH